MSQAFDAAKMAEALDRLASVAIERDMKLDIAIYGGSALMLASNFRYASEDVDVRLIGQQWPEWLTDAVAQIGREMSMADDWFNTHVMVHLSSLASDESDHVLFGTFPRGRSEIGLRVFVPSAEYLLALKLKAMRVLDPTKGDQERADILNLMHVVGCRTPEEALLVLGKFFPRSAMAPEKQMFLLRHIMQDTDQIDAPEYPTRRL